MRKITFILGGTRSGKSSFAVKLAEELTKRTAYIATCIPDDDEMHERVMLHKKERPSEWTTFEEPKELAILLKNINNQFETVIIDCITLFVTNLIMDNLEDNVINDKVTQMMLALKDVNYDTYIVSNEVGLGIVPENALARRFRDIAGKMNQLIASHADNVIFMVSGIPMKIK